MQVPETLSRILPIGLFSQVFLCVLYGDISWLRPCSGQGCAKEAAPSQHHPGLRMEIGQSPREPPKLYDQSLKNTKEKLSRHSEPQPVIGHISVDNSFENEYPVQHLNAHPKHQGNMPGRPGSFDILREVFETTIIPGPDHEPNQLMQH